MRPLGKLDMYEKDLSELSFHILLALANGSAHGYGIAKDVEHRSEGRYRPTTGGLYRALRRMMQDGLIEHDVEATAAADDARRRYFRLTEAGREVARAEAKRLHAMVSTARHRHLYAEPS